MIVGSLGAMLDPSADERGVTAKLGIDATRPFGEPFAEKLVMPPAKMEWAAGARRAPRGLMRGETQLGRPKPPGSVAPRSPGRSSMSAEFFSAAATQPFRY
mgnify:CR=1 FL=1